MLKTNIILILAWAPLVVAYAVALAVRLGTGPRYGIVMGGEVVFLAMGFQPLMIMGHFSSGTNDTRQINRYTLSFFALALILLILLVIAAVGFLCRRTPFWSNSWR